MVEPLEIITLHEFMENQCCDGDAFIEDVFIYTEFIKSSKQ